MKKCLHVVALLFAVLAGASLAHCQDFKTEPQKFWTHQRIAATSANFTVRATDAVYTCRKLNTGLWKEDFFPTQSCRGVALYSAAVAVSSLGVERLLYKNHPRLARVPQWLSFGGAALGIAYTLKRGRL